MNDTKLTSDRTTVVAPSLKWRPITPDTPRAGKVFLINREAGVATTGHVGDPFFTHWFPFPTFDKDEK